VRGFEIVAIVIGVFFVVGIAVGMLLVISSSSRRGPAGGLGLWLSAGTARALM